MDRALTPPELDDIRAARERIAGSVRRTPLIRFETASGEPEIFLKLENLQPIGSFKLRGAMSRMLSLPRGVLDAGGAYTASAGNMAQGVAWAARQLGVAASVVVPDTAPRAKLDAVERLGGVVVQVPYDEWWRTMQDHGRDGMKGTFVHPFADRDVMAGNGTITLEIFEDLPGADTIVVPWGGGGLACGIAAAAREIQPDARVYACEVDGSAPLSESLASGKPVTIENRRTFVDGIGGRNVFPEMWPLAQSLIAGSLCVSAEQVADAVRLIAQRTRCIAEGAGAVALAACLRHVASITPAPKRVVCIVSGGNIDASALAAILSGSIP